MSWDHLVEFLPLSSYTIPPFCMSMEITRDAIPHEMFENYHHSPSQQGSDSGDMQWLNGMLEDMEKTSIFNIEIESPRGVDRDWIRFNGEDLQSSNFECQPNPDTTIAQTMAIPGPIAPAYSSYPYVGMEQPKVYAAQKFADNDESSKLFPMEAEDVSQPKRKKIRTQKLGIKTRTASDSLEDGFKWRKYGRKMLKSSPNPRSYYRCADSGCDVKKTVERDANDSQILITIYEGKHNHPSPSRVYLFDKPITLPPRIPGTKPTVLLVNAGLCV